MKQQVDSSVGLGQLEGSGIYHSLNTKHMLNFKHLHFSVLRIAGGVFVGFEVNAEGLVCSPADAGFDILLMKTDHLLLHPRCLPPMDLLWSCQPGSVLENGFFTWANLMRVER